VACHQYSDAIDERSRNMATRHQNRTARKSTTGAERPDVDALVTRAIARHRARRLAAKAAATATFRTLVEERLRSLEAAFGELRTRLTGLFFLAAGTVLTELALRLFHH
jgi:phosphopantetheinyl transferase (holo-ACP synthase)